MTPARTTSYPPDAIDGAQRHGLSRIVGELAAVIEAAVQIFAEAGDGSAAARARYPSAD